MIIEHLQEQIAQLAALLPQLNRQHYTYTQGLLGNATIGQHTRHIIEVLQCLEAGYKQGCVNYDLRQRDITIENDPQIAINALHTLQQQLPIADRPIEVHLLHSNQVISSSYYREILYNTEHTIHHLALIKVALRHLQLAITDDTFGVAYSTIAYRQILCVP